MAKSDYWGPFVQARIASIEDRDLLVEVGRRTFFETFVGTCSDSDMDLFLITSYAPEKVEAELKDPLSRFLILEDSQGPLGFTRLQGEAEGRAELVRFYMEQRAIGSGHAHTLMQDTLDLAKDLGYSQIYLGVWEKNFRAQKFYMKWGFIKTGEKIFLVGTDPQVDWYYERAL
jgi:GNAT superfamily N-acetyltransferase